MEFVNKQLESVRSTILKYSEFLHYLSYCVKYIESEEVPVAGLSILDNKLCMYYNKKEFDKYTPHVQAYVFCHELYHILFYHLSLIMDLDKDLFNIASDIYINDLLDRTFNTPNNKCEIGVRAAHCDVPPHIVAKGSMAIYYFLKSNPNKLKGQGAVYSLGHKMDDPSNNSSETTEMKEKLKEMIQDATDSIVLNAKQYAGSLPSEVRNKLFKLDKESKHNYRNSISNFIINNSTKYQAKMSTLKKSRYFNNSFTYKMKTRSTIAVIVDTSGSMGGELILKAFSEISVISSNLNCDITIVECDANVTKESVYPFTNKKRLEDKLASRGYIGGGGTVVDPAIKYINKNLDVSGTIYLTDGYVSAPVIKPNAPFVVALVCNNNSVKKEFKGYKVIEIDYDK